MAKIEWPTPKRDDEEQARRWRGPLFHKLGAVLMWKDGHYKTLEPPKSVTFPICSFCGHVIWDWPHYEEAVPDNAICETCFREEQEQQSWER